MSAFVLVSVTPTQPVAPATDGAVEIVVGGTDGMSVTLLITNYLPATPMPPSAGNTATYSQAGIPPGTYNGDAAREDGQSVGFQFTITTLALAVAPTDETAAGANDGTVTLTASGGTPPYTLQVVELALFSSTNPDSFYGLPVGNYTARVVDSSNPSQQLTHPFAIRTRQLGCGDEYADNYDPAVTVGNNSCTYSVLWRSAWQPMAVRVAAQAGQQVGFVAATLRVGFRAGHPLAASRPLGTALNLRATVGPDGYATFVLGPYLHPQLGAPDGAGGYRLDLNSPTAFDADFYVGYELRRADGTLLEHGYAVNSALPDAYLVDGTVLMPFAVGPAWPGFVWATGLLATAGRYGVITRCYPAQLPSLPCPPNPLPVAWLAPGGGYGYWVFQGRNVPGDEVSDGQTYNEASSGQRRYSDPGQARRTVKTSSGAFKGNDLLEGLRTLWRSPQAWYQPVLGGEWVPIVIERGSRDVGRAGIARQELSLSFQVAAPEMVQGQ